MDLIDGITGSSFYFASADYPSRIILPVNLRGEEDNQKTYYLHDGNVIDISQPAGNEQSLNLETTQSIWTGPTISERSKIITDVSVNLYFRNLRLIKKPVTVTLIDNNEIEIATLTQDVDSLNIGSNPTTFTFNDLDYELMYNHHLNLAISLANGTGSGFLRHTKLLYDSADHPSSVTVKFKETYNIQFEISSNPEYALVIPGGEVEYTLSIDSKYDDEISINILKDMSGDWSITGAEDSISVNAGETKEVTVIVKSESNLNDAYGDSIDLTFEVSGKTGLDRKTTTAIVDEEAIEYDIGIFGQDESKNIKKGKSGTFYFVVENKNTGAIDDEDSYSIFAESKNDWEIKYTDSTPPLVIGEKTDAKRIFVKVYVPKNATKKSDTITVTVTSDNNPEVSTSINVTVDVTEPSIFESIVKFFESAAESLGLDDALGSKAPYVLMAGLLLLIIIIIIIIVYLLKKKSVEIICTERVQEIDPDGEAVFEITIRNPTRKTKTFDIRSNVNPISTQWLVATNKENITLEPKTSEIILLVVKPEESLESSDWTEINFNVNASGKKKSKDITIMVMLKEGKTLLRIQDVFSWPKDFKKGDRIITSFKLENKGNISARNVKVVLFINEKEKNKVEVTIPSGGFADIKIPWIALKGKNDLKLKAIEQ